MSLSSIHAKRLFQAQIFLLALCLLPSLVCGELWRFTASGSVDGITNTSTNPAPEGIVLGQPAFSECVYDSSVPPLGTSSNTWYTDSILYARVTIGAYTWRYIGRADSKISCSDNHGLTQDQLIFSGNGYSTNTFPYAHGAHWQVTPLLANDQDESWDMLTSPYIADLPNSFSPALAGGDLIGHVRSDIVTRPYWSVRYSISPGSLSFQPMSKPAPSQLAYSNATFSMNVSNLVPSLTYILEGVAEIGDTNWQPVLVFPAAANLDPASISIDVGGDKHFFRIRGQ